MRAFTLIETLVYIALYSFIIASVVFCVYGISRSGDLFAKRNNASSEGEFVTAKINWALGSLGTITTPSSATPFSKTLTVTRNDGKTVAVRLSGGRVEMNINGGAYTALTTSNVTITDIGFSYISGMQAGVEATTTINGMAFMTRRYLRK